MRESSRLVEAEEEREKEERRDEPRIEESSLKDDALETSIWIGGQSGSYEENEMSNILHETKMRKKKKRRRGLTEFELSDTEPQRRWSSER